MSFVAQVRHVHCSLALAATATAVACRHPNGPCLPNFSHPSPNFIIRSCSLASVLLFSARASVIGFVACHS
jgi:hypothetical protein